MRAMLFAKRRSSAAGERADIQLAHARSRPSEARDAAPDGTSDLTPKQQEEAAAIFGNIFDGKSYSDYKVKEAAKALLKQAAAKEQEQEAARWDRVSKTSHEQERGEGEDEKPEGKDEKLEGENEQQGDRPPAERRADELDERRGLGRQSGEKGMTAEEKKAADDEWKRISVFDLRVFTNTDKDRLYYRGNEYEITKLDEVKYQERYPVAQDRVFDLVQEVVDNYAERGEPLPKDEAFVKAVEDLAREQDGEPRLVAVAHFDKRWNDFPRAIAETTGISQWNESVVFDPGYNTGSNRSAIAGMDAIVNIFNTAGAIPQRDLFTFNFYDTAEGGKVTVTVTDRRGDVGRIYWGDDGALHAYGAKYPYNAIENFFEIMGNAPVEEDD